MKQSPVLVASVAALAFWQASALAQAPPPPPAHPSLLSRLLHHGKPAMPMHAGVTHPGMAMHPGMMHPGMPMHGGLMHGSPMQSPMSSMSGGFIGNKKSHVFHMPGDKGAMPAPQNRVYFRSAAAAEAAGYHQAGSSKSMTQHMKMTH